MLQSLYCTPAFRRLVFEFPTTGVEQVETSIPLCLQRLFAQMQLGTTVCSTKALTTSFGWGDEDTFVQHDVQEFCRVLMDNLESKMKETLLEGRVANLFRGKFLSYVRCPGCDYKSERVEDFYDLSMTVRNCPDLFSSFEKYTEKGFSSARTSTSSRATGSKTRRWGPSFWNFPRFCSFISVVSSSTSTATEC
jgi:ubiquitin carboxyl-terminal hydrolase 7